MILLDPAPIATVAQCVRAKDDNQKYERDTPARDVIVYLVRLDLVPDVGNKDKEDVERDARGPEKGG